MDVVSLGKAMSTLRNIQELNDAVIGQKAEGHFKTVDHRLDWIEGQADKMLVEGSKQIDLNQGLFYRTEIDINKIKLQEVGKTIKNSGTNLLLNNLNKTFEFSFSPNLFRYSNQGESAMFDGDPGNMGANSSINSTFPGWFQISFHEAKNLSKMRFIYNGYGKPREWKVEGSNDEIEFDLIYHEANETKTEIDILIEDPVPYKYYRITWNSIRSGNRMTVNEVEFYEQEEINTYFPQGTWTSPVIDLGIGWKETKLVDVLKQETANATVTLEVATSTDGVSFTPFTLLDESNPQQSRYVKIRATLSTDADIGGEDKTLDFDQSSEENRFTLNDYVEANGELKLVTSYTSINETPTPEGVGQVYEYVIDKSKFKKIESISVN
ncbi:MAG: hypothetical protein IKF29_11540 [Oceanobacillus sp.]|nr:hypothetical protein [Oceanobacillus sp.]